MALADVKSGRSVATPDKLLRNAQTHDYSHLLPPEARAAKYRLTVSIGDSYEPGVRLQHGRISKGREDVGNFYGSIKDGEALAGTAHVEEEHRGKGLGSAMYEAWFAHAHNHGGADRVKTTEISTDSDSVLKRLATKHGLDYHSDLVRPLVDRRSFDSRYAPTTIDL